MLEFLKNFFQSAGKPRKTRRRLEENEFLKALRYGWLCRVLLLAVFVVGLGMLIFTGGQPEPLKNFLISLLILVTAVAQLYVNHAGTLQDNRLLSLVLCTMLIQLLVIKLILLQADLGHVDLQLVPLLVPYAFAPLVLSVLLGKNHGLYAAVFTSLWGAFLMRSVDPVFLVISLISGFVAVYVTWQVRRRSCLIRAGVYVGAITLILATMFGQIGPFLIEAPLQTDWAMVGLQCFAALGVGIGTAVVVSGLLPVLESLFGITTEISWLEMADLNHPLLKRLSLEAPGTYHHSLAVANLAEAAAEKVNANPTICRVIAYFHDIGKLVKPDYFSENMHTGVNPHDDLTPTMSALIIISHVKEGIDLALKHKLNPRILEAIREHHGTSLVSYFYQRALNQQKDAELGGKILNLRAVDVPQVSEANFRYPGPRPRTKETAILCLADAVESASRSLERPTPQRIEDLVNRIIEERLLDHQLDDAPVTLAELKKIGESFRFSLQSMLHLRVPYPRREGRGSVSVEIPQPGITQLNPQAGRPTHKAATA
jgi:putative nucleotidyltransferase with HDIG domain